MTKAEKRRALEKIGREAKRLSDLASQSGEDFLAFVLMNAQLETERTLMG